MSNDKEKIYESTYQELRNTLQEQLTAHHELNQRAIDLVKIQLLSISVLVSGITLSGQLLDIFVHFVAGTLSLLYSLWSCVQVYHPRQFARGIGAEAANEVKENVQAGLTSSSHYEDLVESCRAAIVLFRDAYSDEVGHFHDALWASIAAIMFFVAAAVRLVLPVYPRAFDIPMLFVIPIVVLWGRDKYADDLPTANERRDSLQERGKRRVQPRVNCKCSGERRRRPVVLC